MKEEQVLRASFKRERREKHENTVRRFILPHKSFIATGGEVEAQNTGTEKKLLGGAGFQ